MSQIPNAISVIIPTYNRAHLIKQSLQSVLDQTLKPYEIIVVDDFSTDNTEEVIKSLNSPLIKYVKNQRKKGANGARNTGILIAQGEYIAFHDSDDIWLPKKLELQKAIMEIDTSNHMNFCCMEVDKQQTIPKKKIHDVTNNLKKKNFISTQTIFLRADAARVIMFDENLKRFQDWDFCLRFSEYYKIFHLDKVLVIQRLSNDSITNKVNYLDSYEAIFKKHPYLRDFGIYNKVLGQELIYQKEKNTVNFFKLFFLKIMRRVIMMYSF